MKYNCFTPSPKPQKEFRLWYKSPRQTKINKVLNKVIKRRKIERRGMPELFSPTRIMSPKRFGMIKNVLKFGYKDEILNRYLKFNFSNSNKNNSRYRTSF